jgi:hypothetical protein
MRCMYVLLQVMESCEKNGLRYGSTIEGFLWQSFVVEVFMDYVRIE